MNAGAIPRSCFKTAGDCPFSEAVLKQPCAARQFVARACNSRQLDRKWSIMESRRRPILRFRLSDRRVRVRRQRLGLAPGRKGLFGGRDRARQALADRRFSQDELEHPQVSVGAARAVLRHPGDHDPARRDDSARLRRRRRQPRVCQHAVDSARRRVRRSALAGAGRLEGRPGAALCARRSGCSASRPRIARPRRTTCCARSPTRWGAARRIIRPRSAFSLASPARPCPIPTSAAADPSGPAARSAAAAWSAAGTTPRTRSTRTISTSPSSLACKSFPRAKCSTCAELPGGGYEVETRKITDWIFKRRRNTARARRRALRRRVGHRAAVAQVQTARFARAALGAAGRLRAHQQRGPGRPPPAGVRDVDYSRGIAIASGFWPDDETHVEMVRYGTGTGFHVAAVHGAGWRRTALAPAAAAARRDRASSAHSFCRLLNPFGWARRTGILLVMQPLPNYMSFRLRRRWFWPFGKRLDSVWHSAEKVPKYFPIANQLAERLAEKMDGDPSSGLARGAVQHHLDGPHPGRLPDGRRSRPTA